MRRFAVPMLLLALVAAACDGGGSSAAPGSPSASPSPSPTPSPTPEPASPTPPALPDRPPAKRGAPSPTCMNGWKTPPGGSRLFTDPLGIVRRTTGVKGPLEVVDMRFFIGEESPPADKGYLQGIQRWYIKLYAADDLWFQGRFLVESRRFGRGLSAVAPYDTRGFDSPDWRGFQFDGADTSTRIVPGLPGEWSGIEYDFVKGGAGLDIPGLPPELAGCLDGT